MKSFFVLAGFTLALVMGAATVSPREAVPTATVQTDWTPCGQQNSSFTAGVYTAGVAAPAVTARTKTGMEATYNWMYIDPAWNYISLRNSSTTDGDSTVYNIYVADLTGDYVYVDTLTFTTGTQTNSKKTGYEFADTLTVTGASANGYWPTSETTCSPTGEYVATYTIDRLWARKIAIVPTTVTNSAYLEIIGF